MSDGQPIQVNFGRAMPLFPLDTVALLPQQVLPLHIFEPRYKQMVERALDGPGQFATAVFAGHDWKKNYHGRPAIRPAVCIVQIVQHEKQQDGCYNLLVQGVCRARVVEESPPAKGRLYREATLEPIGIDDEEDFKLGNLRERLREMLTEGPLTRLAAAAPIVERIDDEEIPTPVILDLVAFAIPTRRDIRYRLLAEGDASERAECVEQEMVHLQHVLKQADAQHADQWPKGCSWN